MRDTKLTFMEIFMIVLFIACIAVVAVKCALPFTGNKQIFDTTYGFNYAYISLPNGTLVEGEVESWRDYDDGDQLQVTIDGTTYLVHSSDCVLVSKG